MGIESVVDGKKPTVRQIVQFIDRKIKVEPQCTEIKCGTDFLVNIFKMVLMHFGAQGNCLDYLQIT